LNSTCTFETHILQSIVLFHFGIAVCTNFPIDSISLLSSSLTVSPMPPCSSQQHTIDLVIAIVPSSFIWVHQCNFPKKLTSFELCDNIFYLQLSHIFIPRVNKTNVLADSISFACCGQECDPGSSVGRGTKRSPCHALLNRRSPPFRLCGRGTGPLHDWQFKMDKSYLIIKKNTLLI